MSAANPNKTQDIIMAAKEAVRRAEIKSKMEAAQAEISARSDHCGLVAFCGRMGAGKSAAANLLAAKLRAEDVTVALGSFARALRVAVSIFTGGKITIADTETTDGKAAKIPAGCLGANLAELKSRILAAMAIATGVTSQVGDASLCRAASALANVTFTSADDGKIPVATPNYTVGRLLQLFGTEVGRKEFGEDVWVDTFRRARLESGAEMYIASDLRFENEAAYVRASGGRAYRIERPDAQSATDIKAAAGRDAVHASETQMLDPKLISGVIVNEGTLADLEEKICKLGIAKPDIAKLDIAKLDTAKPDTNIMFNRQPTLVKTSASPLEWADMFNRQITKTPVLPS